MPEYYIKREIFHIHKELIFYFSFITVVKILTESTCVAGLIES